jgi:isopenicillin N synthase-like dioxygenase
MHRVVVPSALSLSDDTSAHPARAVRGSRRRLSVPFFHNANWDAVVECLVKPGEAPRHPPVTAGHHLMSKFRSTVT